MYNSGEPGNEASDKLHVPSISWFPVFGSQYLVPSIWFPVVGSQYLRMRLLTNCNAVFLQDAVERHCSMYVTGCGEVYTVVGTFAK